MKVGVVCTNYNNSSYTRGAIASLRAGARWEDVQVVVVDNRSNDRDVAALREMTHGLPNVTLLLNPENVGYFPGLNVGSAPAPHPSRDRPCRGRQQRPGLPADLHRDGAAFPGPVRPVGGDRPRPRDARWGAPEPARPLPLRVDATSALGALLPHLPGRDVHAADRQGDRRDGDAAGAGPHQRALQDPGTDPDRDRARYLLGPRFFRHFDGLCAPTFLMAEEAFLTEQLKTIDQLPYYDPRFSIVHHDHATMDILPGRWLWQVARDGYRTYQRYLEMPRDGQLRFIADHIGRTAMILITGGAGFIGSNFVRHWLAKNQEPVVDLDKLTYAGNLASLADLAGDPRHLFVRGDIGDRELVAKLLETHQPRAIVNFAAESHVDRSIHGPGDFIQTNVLGTFALLESVRAWWSVLPAERNAAFRFLHVSTDEVYGSLAPTDPAFSETNPYQPNSPYSASKAASDHLVRAWHHTYGLPVVTTNCSNNYGPSQFPEKLIPLIIHNALAGKPLPIYGDGQQVRDWLYVEDHCRAIVRVLEAGRVGEVYNVGGWNEQPNLQVVRTICTILDQERPRAGGGNYADQITFVKDRPGHDRRYAIDAGKIERDLGWRRPQETFESGIRKTVAWYLGNQAWVDGVTSGSYRHWVDQQYGR